MTKTNKIFTRNVLNTDVDALSGTIRYTVRAMYDVVDADGVADIEQKVIEDLTMTWDEVVAEGGPGEVKKQFDECYNINQPWE